MDSIGEAHPLRGRLQEEGILWMNSAQAESVNVYCLMACPGDLRVSELGFTTA